VDAKQADQNELLALKATQEQSACQHHWVIDPPEGPVSKGTCRSCGEEREFLNYTERPYNPPSGNPSGAD